MRILAIRGCNLASLAGEFEIDLANGPLGASGVFAIVGNTGAGKSTLLDALCVALFDRTPRLANHSRVVVGRGDEDPHALGAHDVRTLLRRGASSGWAEVDFESGDARRYRARWSVRRARGQADGVLQAQQVSLTSLDGTERLGGTKTETLDAIHERLGLTFDQFRRSALLAQGDFAAFLRADGKDRGELLERMTGTEIYTRLSVAAHANATAALAKLDAERTRADAIPVLADEERSRAEEELRFAGAAKSAARARLQAGETAARWLFETATRADGVRAAEASHASASSSLEAAGALRDELALRRRVEQLRGPWEHAQRAEGQLAVARGESSSATEAASGSLVLRDGTREQHAELAEVLVPLRAARIAAGLVERAPQMLSGRNAHVGAGAGQGLGRTAYVGAGGDRAIGSVHVGAGAGQGLGRTAYVGAGGGQGLGRTAHVGAGGDRAIGSVHVDADAGQELGRTAYVGAGGGQGLGRTAHVGAGGDRAIGSVHVDADAGQELGRNQHTGAGAGHAVGSVHVDANAGQALGRNPHSGAGAGQTHVSVARYPIPSGDHAALAVGRGALDDAGSVARYPIPSGDHAALAVGRGALDDASVARYPIPSGDHAALAVGRGALDDAEWLSARPALATEIATWSDLDAKFAQHATAADSANGLVRSLAEHTERREKLEQSRAALTDEVRTATDKHTDAQRKAEAFNKKRGLTLEAARRAEDTARVRKTDVEALVTLAASARTSLAACIELDHQLAEMSANAAADTEARVSHESSRTTAITLRTERARVVVELRKAAGYEHARAELVDGDPCPLCGADEHPWRHRGALDDVIVSADKALEEAAAQLDAATTAIAQIDARTAQRKTDRARLIKQRTAAQTAADAATPTWAENISALGELLIVTDPASPEGEQLAADLLAAAGKALEAARATRSQTEAATKAAAEAQADVTLCQTRLDECTARATELDRKLAELDAAIGRLDGERTMRAERCAELVRELLAAAARWRSAAEALAEISAEGSGGTASSSGVAGSSGVGGSSGVAGSSGVGGSSGVAGSSGVVGSSGLAGSSGRTSKRTARGTNGTGTAADVTELAIQRAWMSELATAWRSRAESVARAESVVAGAVHAALEEFQRAERAVVELSARAAAAEKRVVELTATLTAANDELAAARANVDVSAVRTNVDGASASASATRSSADGTVSRSSVGAATNRPSVSLSDEQLRILLSSPPARIDDLASELALLERSVETTRAILNERRRLAADHRATQPALLDMFPVGADPRAIAITLDALTETARVADDNVATLTGTLAADTDARARRDQLQALVVEAERAADVDRILGAAIGSHDGKRFRSFAQSLTLDGLLTVANAHLVELAPRYQLERVPKHDLELQVIDRDLGDEVRSVQSLSGGESFLVSLALALGLSSMSAHDVRVRTLLIDEGFGTLDPSTLEMALSVLEALRQQGRQVGVISHVPQLVERVGAHVKVIARGGGRSEVVVA